MISMEFMEPIFDIFERTRGVPQSPIHHPEGDVMNHSLQVLKIALRESRDLDLVLAAWLHDVGKVETNKEGAELKHGHDLIAVEWFHDLLSPKSLFLIEHHMRVWAFIKGEMKRLKKVQDIAGHPWLPELVHLARMDKMGRNPHRKLDFDRHEVLEQLNIVAHNHFMP